MDKHHLRASLESPSQADVSYSTLGCPKLSTMEPVATQLRKLRPLSHGQIKVRGGQDRYGLRVICRCRRRHDIRHPSLRITVIEREPTRLHLHHQLVPRQK